MLKHRKGKVVILGAILFVCLFGIAVVLSAQTTRIAEPPITLPVSPDLPVSKSSEPVPYRLLPEISPSSLFISERSPVFNDLFSSKRRRQWNAAVGTASVLIGIMALIWIVFDLRSKRPQR